MENKGNKDITYFGKTTFRKSRKVFGILQADRFFHTYILGKTGTGKSNLLLIKLCRIFKITEDVYCAVFTGI